MNPLSVLTSLSFLTSTVALIIGALVLFVSPALWIIPGAFLSTFIYHTLVLLFARSKSSEATAIRSTRSIPLFTVAGAYALAALWTTALTIALVFIVLISIKKHDIPPQNTPAAKAHFPLLISACAIALVEAFLMGSIAFLSHKARRKAQYHAKWEWKITLNTSKWSITKDTKDPPL